MANDPIKRGLWTPLQAFLLATICFVIGLSVGYLVRGSAANSTPTIAAESATTSPAAPHSMGAQQKMPTLDDMKRMADKQAQPLLAKLKSDPRNAQLLNQVGMVYKSTHQFKQAQEYFAKSLEIDPKNVAVRTDMASCLYYSGDIDGALAELNRSLTYDPKHPGTLLNIGIIRWKAKNDVDGAVASWQKLLKLNPDYDQRAVVEHLIAQARESKAAHTITGAKS